MPYQQVFLVRPGETRTLSLDFTGKLASGVTVVSATVAATNQFTGITDNTILSSTTATPTSTSAAIVALGSSMTLGVRYEVTFTVTLSDATPTVIKDTVIVICTDCVG